MICLYMNLLYFLYTHKPLNSTEFYPQLIVNVNQYAQKLHALLLIYTYTGQELYKAHYSTAYWQYYLLSNEIQ